MNHFEKTHTELKKQLEMLNEIEARSQEMSVDSLIRSDSRDELNDHDLETGTPYEPAIAN